MGNVPISCCRSKSPSLAQSSSNSCANSTNHRNGTKSAHSSNSHDGKQSGKNKLGDDSGAASGKHPSHNLQHISEREPDDSETDPSSNPIDRPIFAARSSNVNKNRTNSYNDSCSSNISTVRRQNNTPLMSSQDYGYSSTTSTNLTHYDGQLIDSFESSIRPRQQAAIKDHDELISTHNVKTLGDNRSSLLTNSLVSSEDTNHSSSSVNKLESSQESKDSNQRNLLKSSSCSTIYLDGSTISQPNLKQTIKCVSLAIYYHIKNRTSDGSADIFDETIHPLRMPSPSNPDIRSDLIVMDQDVSSSNKLVDPDQKAIYHFVKTLFKAAQLTSEYAITTLVYLERLMTYAEMDLTPKTWRRMFLGAILLSSKVWEDQAVWNVDYAQILEEISVEDINELERQFLELIQFNMNVPSSVYANYYFHLRTLALKNGLGQERFLLTVNEAKTLEAISRVHVSDWHASPIHRKASPDLKRHTSLEKLRLSGHAIAVLM